MGIIAWIVLGLIAGLIASKQRFFNLSTWLTAIAGAVVSGRSGRFAHR